MVVVGHLAWTLEDINKIVPWDLHHLVGDKEEEMEDQMLTLYSYCLAFPKFSGKQTRSMFMYQQMGLVIIYSVAVQFSYCRCILLI